MVSNHAKRHVDLFLLSRLYDGQRRRVTLAALFFELSENRAEHVCVVIRNCLSEVCKIVRRLHDRRDALETHPGIDMLGRQRRKRAIDIRVVLNENKVPNLDTIRAVGVDQTPFRIAGGGEVDVQFAARPARPGVAHHPKIILLVAIDNMHLRIEASFFKNGFPKIVRLLIQFTGVAFARFVHRRVQPLFRKLPNLGDQFPSPLDGFLFKIIPERPIAEHLEKRMMIRIHSYVLEVVVLAARANALLRIGSTPR